ncbi:Pre-mRNA-processing factor 31 [Colletotrichum siamense]|uniref:Pre-mRNA-processing factor 31 n=1 Tax=Colletotrichum siamense TaxID=690259 RepID=A0A9P5EIS0_COLSI|nr:Pre-mRNA-processing factor 31 [Colletotrichum siamense]KAF4831829.1 Pre-mRNA-processing factor 31 [Colletotrichum siamense]KAF4847620.1 Pre-mRNA-processing factor 31 [Colletotrichum siamense]KAF4868030.1 Pre-mRNA-processing factor 31 [Colletotrichum siamense]
MATLAEELFNDFADSGSEADETQQDGNDALGLDLAHQTVNHSSSNDMDLDADDIEADADDDVMAGVSKGTVDTVEDAEDAKSKVEKMQLGGVSDVRSVASLMQTLEPVIEVSKHPLNTSGSIEAVFTSRFRRTSPDFVPRMLQRIAHYQSQPTPTQLIGNIEDHPEYHLLTQSNSLSTLIDSEIVLVHKFIRDHYSIRFPELETLITNPLEYAKVVAILGNGPLDSENIKTLQHSTDNPLKASLRSVLDGPSLMIVTVEATTTKGREMSLDELMRVQRACEMVLSLDRAKKTLTEYVQSRMNLFAPNLTAMIGSLTAAQLLNAAGGLTGLSKTPACNIAAWGSKKGAGAAGLATNIGIRQQGFLYHSPIIQGIPNDLKKQAMRIVAAKLLLAARVDRVHSSPDGSTGEELKGHCLERLEKLTEPPPNKGPRALPVPDDKPSRKRGGRRARKAKEATAMTELRKAQNRMAFGKEEREVGYGTGEGTAGLGMIGQANDGRIRNLQIDQRTRAKLSAKNKGWGGATSLNGAASSLRGFGQANSNIDLRGKGLRTSGVGTTLGAPTGTASSLAFTPVQGLELVDPKVQAELSRKRKAEEDRWFKGGTFTQVAGSSNGGFKKPDLPPSKKVDTGAGKMGPPPPRSG